MSGMFKKCKEVTPGEAGQTYRHDLLGRKQQVDRLMALVERTSTPYVLCLDAPWGAGKTTLVDFWRAELHQKQFSTLYYNAWENDYHKEPLISMIMSLSQVLPDDIKNDQEFVSKLKGLFKVVAPIAVKAATAGLVGASELEIIKEVLPSTSEKLTEHYFAAFGEKETPVAKFRVLLNKIADHVIMKDKPIIFFIDELDRCRPTYCIELLEAIKHFFSTEKFFFVLSLDRKQLGHSLKSVYGQGMNTERYLKRFIDLNIELTTSQSKMFVANRMKEMGVPNLENLVNHVATICEIYRANPREMEKFIEHIAHVVMQFDVTDNLIDDCCLVFLIGLVHFDQDAYINTLEGEELDADYFAEKTTGNGVAIWGKVAELEASYRMSRSRGEWNVPVLNSLNVGYFDKLKKVTLNYQSGSNIEFQRLLARVDLK